MCIKYKCEKNYAIKTMTGAHLTNTFLDAEQARQQHFVIILLLIFSSSFAGSEDFVLLNTWDENGALCLMQYCSLICKLVQKQFHTKIAGKFIAKKQQELTLH